MTTDASADLFAGSSLDAYASAMHGAVDTLAAHVRGVRQPRTAATEPQLRELVDAVDLDTPLGGTGAALAEISGIHLEHAVWFHEPGYMAHLNCPVAIPALAAEVLVSGVNSSVDTWDQSTTGTLLEQRVIDWTATRIGFGHGADGVFTSGGTQSNLQALLLAREEALSALRGRPGTRSEHQARLRVLATDQSHFSVQKSARLLGLREDAVVVVATDPWHRMDPSALAEALDAVRRAGDVPMAVVATAGTTDLGCIDPVDELADVCAARGVWLHVDAAYGCGLLVSQRRRHLLDGVQRADSVTVDYHKSFFQPVSSSALLVRDGRHLRHVTFHADYLNPRGDAVPNQVDKSLQTTRRLDALKLWLTLRAMGADRIGDLFDRVVDLAASAYYLIVDDDDLDVLAAPTLSTVLFRYKAPGMSDADADRLTPRIREHLFAQGQVIVARTVVDGRPWLKLTLLNPMATVADVRTVLDAVRRAAQELLPLDAAEQEQITRRLRDMELLDRLGPDAAVADGPLADRAVIDGALVDEALADGASHLEVR